MIVEVLVASPRKNGNSQELSESLTAGLDKKKVQSGISFLYEHELGPCIDCRACKRNELVCTKEDGMQALYKKIDAADFLVFATPIYWYGPTGTMKLLLERLRPYYMSKRLAGKKAAIILPAGNGAEDCDLTITMFQRIFRALGLDLIKIITPKAFNPGDALRDDKAMEDINELSMQINAMAV